MQPMQSSVPLNTVTSDQRNNKTLLASQSNERLPIDSGLSTGEQLTDSSPTSPSPQSGASTPPPAYYELDWCRLPQPPAVKLECKASPPSSYKDYMK